MRNYGKTFKNSLWRKMLSCFKHDTDGDDDDDKEENDDEGSREGEASKISVLKQTFAAAATATAKF